MYYLLNTLTSFKDRNGLIRKVIKWKQIKREHGPTPAVNDGFLYFLLLKSSRDIIKNQKYEKKILREIILFQSDFFGH